MLFVNQHSFIVAAVEFFGAIMCFVAIVMDMSSRKVLNEKETRLGRLILLFSLFSLVSDGVSYLIDLNNFKDAILINKIILFVDFASYLSAFLFMYLFVIAELPVLKDGIRGAFKGITYGLIAVDYLFLIINIFTGFVYYVDSNNKYVDNWGLRIYNGILFLLAIMLIIALVKAKKRMEKSVFIPVMLCLGFLIAGGVSEGILVDFPGTNLGICIGVLLIYWIYRTKYLRQNGEKNRYKVFVVYLFLGMTAGIFLTYIINVSAIMNATRDNLKSSNETIANMINESVENLFIRPITVSDTMSQSSIMKKALLSDADTDMEYVNEELVDYLSSIRDGMDYQMVFLVSDLNKKYYTYNGISKIIDTENDHHDIWYKDFLATNMDYNLTVDTDEVNNWSLSVFVNTRVKDDKGNLIGVCGVGVSMNMLQNLILGFEEEYGVNIYLTDHDGLVQISSDGQNIENLKLDNSYFDNVNGKAFYYENSGDLVRLTKYDEALDWYIVVEDEHQGRVSVARIIRPGLIAAVFSVLIMLFAYYWINRNDNRVKNALLENKKKAAYLKKISETDDLTGLKNRHAYEAEKLQIDRDGFGEDFLVMILDINGLKNVNDTIGHDAGDELIRGAAECIENTFSKYGNTYRIGGDEFATMLRIPREQIDQIVADFKAVVENWKGESVDGLAVSVGYAYHAEHEDLNFEQLIKIADSHMYDDKDEYYRRSGLDRRRRKNF